MYNVQCTPPGLGLLAAIDLYFPSSAIQRTQQEPKIRFQKKKHIPALDHELRKNLFRLFFILNILRGIRFEPVVCPPVVGRYNFKALPPTYLPTYLTILSWHACFTDCWELKYLIQNNFGFSGRRSRPHSSLFFPDTFCCTCRCPRTCSRSPTNIIIHWELSYLGANLWLTTNWCVDLVN